MRDWDDPYNEFDFSVIALSYTAAVIFGYTAKALRGSSWKTNLSLLSLVLFMLIVLIWKASIPFYELPWILFIRIFDGTTTRTCLLLFWIINLASSVAFCVYTAHYKKHITTIDRKFFHLTVSAVVISGFRYDPAFTVLSGNLIVVGFIILEILRVHRVSPWYIHLDSNMLPFLDGQDNKNLILTPIHLIAGVFIPSILELILSSDPAITRPPYYAGIITVGVGDAVAAVIGNKFGKTNWGAQLRKSVEGSAAMLFSQIIAHLCLFGVHDMGVGIALIYCASTVLEAGLSKGDNIILPIFAYFLLKIRDYFIA